MTIYLKIPADEINIICVLFRSKTKGWDGDGDGDGKRVFCGVLFFSNEWV
jgi:hypothetical protein